MTRVRRISAGLVIAATFGAACEGSATRPSRMGTATPPTPKVEQTPATSSATPVPSAAAASASPALPTAEQDLASEAQSIALDAAPTLTIKPVGPAAIEVTLSGGPAAWKSIDIERRTTSSGPQYDKFERSPHPTSRLLASTRHIHSAKPGISYVYRARSRGDWSQEITVRTSNPNGAPPAPNALRATAVTPFAVRLEWSADASAASGFELEVEKNGSYVRAAIVDPNVREFVHNLRLPETAYTYRIRSFNAHGASSSTTAAATKTPERSEAARKPLPPCTRLPPEPDPSKLNGIPREVLSVSGHPILYNDPESSNAFNRHLIGEYQGCLRDLGKFTLQADIVAVPGFSDEGFPLLRAVAGAGLYAGAQVFTLRFARGRYSVVDEATFCGEPYPDPDPNDPNHGTEGSDSDLTQYTPPFATCQRDLDGLFSAIPAD